MSYDQGDRLPNTNTSKVATVHKEILNRCLQHQHSHRVSVWLVYQDANLKKGWGQKQTEKKRGQWDFEDKSNCCSILKSKTSVYVHACVCLHGQVCGCMCVPVCVCVMG